MAGPGDHTVEELWETAAAFAKGFGAPGPDAKGFGGPRPEEGGSNQEGDAQTALATTTATILAEVPPIRAAVLASPKV